MARKHKNYIPQVRRPAFIDASQSQEDVENKPESSYEQLNALLEAPASEDEIVDINSTSRYLSVRNALMLGVDIADTSEANREVREYVLLQTAQSFVDFDEFCLMRGIDLVKNPSEIQQLNRPRKVDFFAETANVSNGLSDELGEELMLAIKFSHPSLLEVFTLTHAAALRAIEDIEDGSKSTGFDFLNGDVNKDIKSLKMIYYSELANNPSGFRRKMSDILGQLRNSDTRTFLSSEAQRYDETFNKDRYAEAQQNTAQEIPFLGQEVNYTILPPGTDVREYTEKLVETLSASELESVDLKRVGVLESLRIHFGADRTYYVHGIANTDASTGVRKDYIGLVIQTHDRTGMVTSEDAIAVSPLENRHAGYIFRQDYSTHTSWRETLAQSKDIARANGARPLKFNEVEGRDKYDAYVDKALELLTCPPERFGSDYYLYFKKSAQEYSLRKKPIVKIGSQSLQATAYQGV